MSDLETSIWQAYQDDGVQFIGVSNTNNQNIINNFVNENSLSFPILYDTGSPGGVQGGDVYNLYYMPNDGSPYPRDFIIDQNGIIAYANNEIDTAWMLSVLNDLLFENNFNLGDINQDNYINILDVINLLNFILNVENPDNVQFSLSDLNEDLVINILDVVMLVNLILD